MPIFNQKFTIFWHLYEKFWLTLLFKTFYEISDRDYPFLTFLASYPPLPPTHSITSDTPWDPLPSDSPPGTPDRAHVWSQLFLYAVLVINCKITCINKNPQIYLTHHKIIWNIRSEPILNQYSINLVSKQEMHYRIIFKNFNN